MPRRAKPRRFGGWLGLSALLVIGLPSLLAIAYYGFIASKQYVTSFQFAVRGPSQAALAKSSGGSSMTSAGAMSPDSFVVTDYINSPQAITDVERSLDLKEIFSRPDVDFWARLQLPVFTEDLTKYWNNMVSARFDLISGNITVAVRAFTPVDSQKLAKVLVASADEMFRKLNVQIQKDFVRVADENVVKSQQDLMTATQAVLAFRDKSGLIDPGKTADAGASIIDDLRRQLAALQGQYTSLKATATNSPALTAIRQQIVALEEQIRRESRLGASQVKAVSADTLAKYQTLEVERQTAERLYGEAVSMRTQAFIMAQSQQSYLGLFSAPSLPEASLYPDRPRAIATVILAAALAWFIGMLIVYAVRDHLM
jgi:capsular polysaccharide transport system permease protein